MTSSRFLAAEISLCAGVNSVHRVGSWFTVVSADLDRGGIHKEVFTQVPMHVRSGARCTWTGCVESQQVQWKALGE